MTPPKKVSRLVRHCTRYGEPCLLASDGQYRTSKFVRAAGQRVPRRPYRVTYRLDPAGDLLARTGSIWNRATNSGYVVCFLPRDWYGQHVSRTVRVL